MRHNKFLFNIYESVKTLNKEKMDKNTKKINKIISKLYNNSKLYNKSNQLGGTLESDKSDKDYKEIMDNLSSIETGFLDYFKSLQNYIDIYLKNAKEFEKLLNDRLSIESIEKLKKSMSDLNLVLSDLK
jgi:hypothetical protein